MEKQKVVMVAKMKIVGFKEPVELTEEEGKRVKEVMNDPRISPKTNIDIGNWTGNKAEIRSVWFERFVPEKEYGKMAYSKEDLIALQKELEPYFMKKNDAEYGEKVALFKRLITADNVSSIEMMWSPSLVAKLKELRKKKLSKKEVEEEAVMIVDERFVGRLTQKAENRYLVDKKAIGFYSNGGMYVMRHKDGSIPFTDISERLLAWREATARKEYAQNAELQQLDALAQSMTYGSHDENHSF